MSDIYLALLHWPVLNKQGDTVTTAITCFDLHDIARTALTYGVRGYFVTNPLPSQRKLAQRITGYWQDGPSADWNPTRKEAFQVVRIMETLQQAEQAIERETGKKPRLIATSARIFENSVGYSELRQTLEKSDEPWLLLFGTGWGMAEEVIERADCLLKPIVGPSDYNHLPVRSAVAIILDRLLAPAETE